MLALDNYSSAGTRVNCRRYLRAYVHLIPTSLIPSTSQNSASANMTLGVIELIYAVFHLLNAHDVAGCIIGEVALNDYNALLHVL